MIKRHNITLLFMLVILFLMIFPLVLTFNDIFTKIALQISLYRLLQDGVVPIEVRIVGIIVRTFHVSYTPLYGGMLVGTTELHMTWACLGWQSLLLFFGSLVVGLWGGKYTLLSCVETTFLGIFGVFWINILRISFTVLLFAYAPPVYHVVYHDFLAAFVTIFYLLGFWWFAYKYVLYEKQTFI